MTCVKVDKATWGDGPWQTEPDRVEFRHLGLPCLVTRQPELGHLCGYVAVPPGHPWHGKDWSGFEANVHGGITYARPCADHVCHVPREGESDDVWWVGFDCCHAGDRSPGRDAMMRSIDARLGLTPRPAPFGFAEEYRPLDYVTAQTRALAEQARVAQGWRPR